MSMNSVNEASGDLVPEVKEFLLVAFTKTVADITAKTYLVSKIQAIANDDELIGGLIERMQRGSKADVRTYVDEIFHSFPFGLRTSIVYSLTDIFREWQLQQRARKRQRKNDAAEIFSHGICSTLVKRWKSGIISPTELYAEISAAVLNGNMEPQLAKRMVDLTLQDAGYIRTNNDHADFDRTKRFRADAKGFDLMNLQSVATSLDGSEIEMMTTDGTSTTVSSSKHSIVSKNYPSSYHMTTKGKQLWWRHEGGGDQLFFLQPESSACRPLLLIGSSLKLDNGDLDIEVVIGVDVCPHSSSDDTLSAAILVDGQWLGELDRSTRGMCDGASELGGDDENENNSNGSGDEEESPRVGRSLGATQTVKRRYYCVFVTIINGSVIVRHVTPMHKSLILDQHPTLILSLTPSLAVVAGTNGLLGLVNASAFSLYPPVPPVQSSNQFSDVLNESSDSSLEADGYFPLRSNISNLGDLASRIKIGSVVTLKGGVSPYTTLSLPGGSGCVDRDNEDNESVKGDEQVQGFCSLTVDSFSKDILQNTHTTLNDSLESQRNLTHVLSSDSDRKAKLCRRTPLSRMRDSFSSRLNASIAPENASESIGDKECSGHDNFNFNNPGMPPPIRSECVVTHAADACITALSYSGGDSCVFASGDSAGIVCLWKVSDESGESCGLAGNNSDCDIMGNQCGLVRLAAKPLQMSTGTDIRTEGSERGKLVGSRITSLFMSTSGRHVAVALYDRLLLVALGSGFEQDDPPSPGVDPDLHTHNYHNLPALYIRNSLDIVTGCRAVYSVVFRVPQLHVWRLTDTPPPHPFSPSKFTSRMPANQSARSASVTESRTNIGTGSGFLPSIDPRPTIRNQNSTREREFRFFPDILRRSATPSTCTSQSSSVFSLSLSPPTSPISRRRFSISSSAGTPTYPELQHQNQNFNQNNQNNFRSQSPWVTTSMPHDQQSYPNPNSMSSSNNNSDSNWGHISDNQASSKEDDIDGCEEHEAEHVPSGVTVTAWLHPNVDSFSTRFGMHWNDVTFFGGCFSEADDGGIY